MRGKNMRVVFTGAGLLVLAIAFFLYMLSIASKSNDPAELMRVVGTVFGVVGGIAIAMIGFGLLGKKV
jgi:hypothetical protein